MLTGKHGLGSSSELAASKTRGRKFNESLLELRLNFPTGLGASTVPPSYRMYDRRSKASVNADVSVGSHGGAPRRAGQRCLTVTGRQKI